MPPGEETRPSLSRSTTATRSAPNSTRAWSPRSRTTSPTSSREVRSVATRRSASARRSRLLACSVALTPWIRTPRVRAIARASRWPSSRPSSTAPAMTRIPHGCSPPGMRTTSSSVPMPRIGAGSSAPGRAWIGSGDSRASENRLRPGGTVRPAVMPGPSTSVARETRPPGRSSQMPTSAAPVATRTRWHASSSAESMPLGNDAISARSARRSTPAAESLSVRSGRSADAAQRAAGHARLGDRGRGVRRRRREEPLQVDEPVATIAAIVDPVVAEPAGLAPGPDRVRMHPQHVRRLRHRQRRIARAGSPGAGWRNVGFGKHRWCGAVPCGAGLVP